MEKVSEDLQLKLRFATCLIFRNNDDKMPVILFDIVKLFIALNQTSVNSLLLGGRQNRFNENLDRFLRKLIDAGAKLVFFKRGMEKHDFDKFVKEKKRSYRQYLDCLSDIDEGIFPHPNPCRCRFCPGAQFRELAEKYGEFHLTQRRHFQDIIAYGISHENVLAIMSKNSNLLLFHGTSRIQYWSCDLEHLDFIEFDTKRFNIEAFHKAMHLSSQQMAIFATIVRLYSKYTHFNELFELRSFGNPIADFFRDPKSNVADYPSQIKEYLPFERMKVAALVWKHFEKDKPTADSLIKILKIILKDRADEQNIHRIQEILKKFDITNWPPPIEPSIPAIKNSDFINKMLNSMRFVAFDAEFTDFRPGTGIPYVEMVVPAYRRQAGIVLQHKQIESPKCKLAVKLSHEASFAAVDEEPIYPEGLMASVEWNPNEFFKVSFDFQFRCPTCIDCMRKARRTSLKSNGTCCFGRWESDGGKTLSKLKTSRKSVWPSWRWSSDTC